MEGLGNAKRSMNFSWRQQRIIKRCGTKKRTKTGGPWLSQCFPNLPTRQNNQDGLLKVQVLGLHSQTFESEVPGMWPRNCIFKQSFQVIPGQPAWHWFMKWSMGSIALLKNAFLKSCLFMEFFLAESFVQSTRQVCYLEATSSKSPSLECFDKTNTQFERKTPDNFQQNVITRLGGKTSAWY